MSQKIVPNLWFDTEAEDAANYYLSVFKDGRIITKTHYPKNTDKAGQVLTVEWEVMGMRFVGINGGPMFKFNEAVSFQIDCEDQDEVDYYWDALTADGGKESMCGWCQDKFGLAWQVVPKGMDEVFASDDPDAAARAFEVMQTMRKLDVAALRAASQGAPAA
jgi:predicted 3-demethylubiquinone-9 3-methyltransferase (glyoxalase superfamily)